MELNGPIRSCLQIIREQLSLLGTAQELELAGFRELFEGSDLTVDELYQMATNNCYMRAKKAVEHRLIGGILA